MAGPFLVLLVVCQDPRKGSAEGCKGHSKKKPSYIARGAS